MQILRYKIDFRNGQALNNGYFVEANLNNESKFRTLKNLLHLYSLEDELLIKYLEKTDEPSRFGIRKKYWQQLLPMLKKESEKFIDISASKTSWITAGAGIAGVSYCCEAIKDCARVSIVIGSSNKERNKFIYKSLHNKKDEIESKFGTKMAWCEMPDNKMSYIKFELPNCSMYDEGTWPQMNKFFLERIPKLVDAFSSNIRMIKTN